MGMIIEGSTTKVAYELAQVDVYADYTSYLPKSRRKKISTHEAIHHMMSNEFKEENEWKWS